MEPQERLRPRRGRPCEADGDASASVRAGGGAPAPLEQGRRGRSRCKTRPVLRSAEFMNRGTLRIRLDNHLLMSMLPPRLWIWAATAVFLCAAPADAQFQPRPLNEPATGEQFHIEASAAIWRPSADIVISSESFGIQGTPIDFKQDLGLTDKVLGEFKFTLRPTRHHKLRAQVIPMKYESSTTLTRDVVFNG